MTPTPGSRPSTTCKASANPDHGTVLPAPQVWGAAETPRRHRRARGTAAPAITQPRRSERRHGSSRSEAAISAALAPGRRAPETGHRQPGRRRSAPDNRATTNADVGRWMTRDSQIATSEAQPAVGCPVIDCDQPGITRLHECRGRMARRRRLIRKPANFESGSAAVAPVGPALRGTQVRAKGQLRGRQPTARTRRAATASRPPGCGWIGRATSCDDSNDVADESRGVHQIRVAGRA